jgi:hypothetical protein
MCRSLTDGAPATTKTITESPGCYVYAYSTTSTLTVPAVTKTVTAAPGKTYVRANNTGWG